MIPSFTGLVYLLGFFSFAFLTYRFFSLWKRKRGFVAFNFFLFSLFFSIFCLITSIAGIFFVDNLNFLKIVVISATFLQGLGCAFLGRNFIYLKFPKVSPWYIFAFIFLLGLVATIFNIIYPFTPVLEENNWINWDLLPISGIFRVIYFLIGTLPIGILMVKEGFSFREDKVKLKALGIGLILMSILLWGPLIFIFRMSLPETLGEDFIFLLLFSIIFIVTLLTQKPTDTELDDDYIHLRPR